MSNVGSEQIMSSSLQFQIAKANLPRRMRIFLTLTREFPIGDPPIKSRASMLSQSLSGTTKESPIKTPLYPSTYMRRVNPPILPSFKAWIQKCAKREMLDERQGASPPEVIMATLTCLPVSWFSLTTVIVLCGACNCSWEIFMGFDGFLSSPSFQDFEDQDMRTSSSYVNPT